MWAGGDERGSQDIRLGGHALWREADWEPDDIDRRHASHVINGPEESKAGHFHAERN